MTQEIIKKYFKGRDKYYYFLYDEGKHEADGPFMTRDEVVFTIKRFHPDTISILKTDYPNKNFQRCLDYIRYETKEEAEKALEHYKKINLEYEIENKKQYDKFIKEEDYYNADKLKDKITYNGKEIISFGIPLKEFDYGALRGLNQ